MTSARRLRIGVAELLDKPGERRRLELVERFDDVGLSTSRVDADIDVELDLTLDAIFGGLTLAGDLRGSWVGECRRCLQPAAGEFEARVEEVFSVDPVSVGDAGADEGQDDRLPINGDHVDLEDLIREALLLALPIAPLCRDECPGPAPEEYPTIIEGEGDEVPRSDPRWAALDDLTFDE